MTEQHKSMQKSVLAAIEAGQVKMRPKWQFILQATLFIVGMILVFLASLFIGSFIIFMLHQSGAWFTPSFGTSGIRQFFMALPLLFIFLAVIFIVALELLVRHYSFGYGRPMLYSVAGVVVLVVLGSVVIAQSSLHEGLLQQARENRLPIAGRLYMAFGEMHADQITPGVIIARGDGGFIMRDPQRNQFIVVITSKTRLPYGADFEPGDYVVVLGEREGNRIEADGIREFEPRGDMFHMREEMHK